MTFHSQTIKLIKKILDQVINDGSKPQQGWIQDEAMNMTKLQEAGTFQNALVRKFDGLIVPVFTTIIYFINKYSNLKLLSSGETMMELKQLWLHLYSSEHVNELIMSSIRSTPDDVSIKQFSCQFPFSWILNDIINANPTKGMNDNHYLNDI